MQLRHHVLIDRIRQGRQASRPGGDHCDTLAGAAGHPDGCRICAGLRVELWTGVGAPKDTPAEIIDKLNKEINAALADPQFKARLADLGGTASSGSPAEFGKFIASETEKWAKVVKFAGVKAD